jgi:hypothetical protein
MLLIGIGAIAWTMLDVFQSVIVPRAPTLPYRISYIVWRTLWRIWPPVGRIFYPRDATMQEEFLASFAPFTLIFMFLAWIVILILGFGVIFFALRDGLTPPQHSYWDTAYYAGTSLLTLGFGDITARAGLARFVSLCAGATGFGVFSITTAYLFAIFGTFQRRESFIVQFAARAGAPPSALALFEIAAKTGTQKSLEPIMRESQEWIASLMESHLAYPVLAFFRSSHDDQSWVGTLGALLDAALLANTVLSDGEQGEAYICFALGRHAVHDLAGFFGISDRVAQDAVIPRADFDRACDRLAAAGYHLQERDAAWSQFSRKRADYASYLDAMARFFHIPPVAWLGSYWRPHAGNAPL